MKVHSRIIPRNVLAGEVPEYKTVNTIFLNTLIQGLLRRVFLSYQDRSHLDQPPEMSSDGPPKIGRSDDWGNTWEQLKPKTIKMKANQRAKGVYSQYLSQINSIGAKRVLEGLADIDDRGGDGINVRTGQLLASFFPPPLINGYLRVGPDQDIDVDKDKVKFSSDVPHAEAVQASKRPIFPPGMIEQWHAEASKEALTAAEDEYLKLKKS